AMPPSMPVENSRSCASPTRSTSSARRSPSCRGDGAGAGETMDSADKVFTGSVPQIYQRLMVPLIFAPYARDLAARIARARPRKVLEIAAGPGAVTRDLAAQLPADTGITATDLNEPMLAEAKAALPDPRVEWRQADALALPFADASFDAVAC